MSKPEASESLALKVRIAILWVFLNFTMYLALDGLEAYRGGLPGLVAGAPTQLVPYLLLFHGVILLVPFTMAILTLALKDSSSRRVNQVMGVVFTLFLTFGAVSLAWSQQDVLFAYLVLLQAAGLVACLLVTRYAFRWPDPGFRV